METRLNSTRCYSRIDGGGAGVSVWAWHDECKDCARNGVCKQNRKTKANDERFVGNTQKLTNSEYARQELKELKGSREMDSMKKREGTTLGCILSASSADDPKGD